MKNQDQQTLKSQLGITRVRSRWDHSSRFNMEGHHTVSEDAETQQQFKNECDVNLIVKNAQRGVAPRFLAKGEPQWGDFSAVPSIGEAYDLISRAEQAFMNLPAALRRELDNDPTNITSITADQVERYGLGKVISPESEAEGASPRQPGSPLPEKALTSPSPAKGKPGAKASPPSPSSPPEAE